MAELNLTWKDVIDSVMLDLTRSGTYVTSVNEFVYKYTNFQYFLFNNVVYRTSYPASFTMQDCDTGLSSNDIS
jgi:hypothetical protein